MKCGLRLHRDGLWSKRLVQIIQCFFSDILEQIVLEPEPKASKCWSRSQKIRCRSLNFEYRLHSLALEAVCWLWLGCWSNNAANSPPPSPGALNNRVLRSCLVPKCSHPSRWTCHQRRLANCGWIPASYSSGQPFYPRTHLLSIAAKGPWVQLM